MVNKSRKRNMIKTVLPFLLLISWTFSLVAQEGHERKFSFGIQGNQTEGRLGIGFHVTSPVFAEVFAIRVSAHALRPEHLELDNWNDSRTSVWNIRLGLTAPITEIGDNGRLYGEGGFVGIIPNRKISANIGMGVYVLIGTEHTLVRNLNLFLEIGGIGYEHDLNKLFNGEAEYYGFSHYSFLISSGLRFYLP